MELIVGGGFALLLRDSFVVAREGMLVLPLSSCLAGLLSSRLEFFDGVVSPPLSFAPCYLSLRLSCRRIN